MAILTWLGVPGDPDAWEALGFRVEDGCVTIGRVLHALGNEPSWGFEELHSDASPLGVPTLVRPRPPAPATQPNGVDRVDHVVYAVTDLEEAVAALTAVLGEPPRRRAHPRGPQGPEMAFFGAGDGFIEVVASGRPPSLWGIAFNSPDLDATVEAVRASGGPVGDPKPAVQGGRIASVWRGHVGWGIAIMEPSRDP